MAHTYPIPPTNEAFSTWTEIDVPIVTHTLDDGQRHAERRAIHFNERMQSLDFYVEDGTGSSYECASGKPWRIVQVTERNVQGHPFHFFTCWTYTTREEALLIAQLANWFKYDDHAVDALLVQGSCDEHRLFCEMHERDYWIHRLTTLEAINQRRIMDHVNH